MAVEKMKRPNFVRTRLIGKANLPPPPGPPREPPRRGRSQPYSYMKAGYDRGRPTIKVYPCHRIAEMIRALNKKRIMYNLLEDDGELFVEIVPTNKGHAKDNETTKIRSMNSKISALFFVLSFVGRPVVIKLKDDKFRDKELQVDERTDNEPEAFIFGLSSKLEVQDQ